MHTASSLIRRVLQLQCQGYSLYCGEDQGVNTLFSGKIAAADGSGIPLMTKMTIAHFPDVKNDQATIY
jgi:hypothetical protein